MATISRKALLLLGLLASVHLFAQNATSNLPASANIMPNCQFIGENITLAFGSYDPIVSNVTQNKESSTKFRMRCVKGTSATIGISDGLNAQSGIRRMRGTSNDYLRYDLYKTGSFSTPWNMSSQVTYSAENPQAQSFSIYGRIPAGQDVASGTYSDTVTLSVTF